MLDNEYINYSELSNDVFLNRTNNYLESFHCSLNQSIDAYHPKLSYLVYKYQLNLVLLKKSMNLLLNIIKNIKLI